MLKAYSPPACCCTISPAPNSFFFLSFFFKFCFLTHLILINISREPGRWLKCLVFMFASGRLRSDLWHRVVAQSLPGTVPEHCWVYIPINKKREKRQDSLSSLPDTDRLDFKFTISLTEVTLRAVTSCKDLHSKPLQQLNWRFHPSFWAINLSPEYPECLSSKNWIFLIEMTHCTWHFRLPLTWALESVSLWTLQSAPVCRASPGCRGACSTSFLCHLQDGSLGHIQFSESRGPQLTQRIWAR